MPQRKINGEQYEAFLIGGGVDGVPIPIAPDVSVADVFGRLKTSYHQNIYDADFEYGPQPLRWESFNANGGTITHLPDQGGVRMRVPTTSGAINIRQSRPYHRYQPGKSIFMASAVTFGTALTNQVNRVGFFDDSNGAFFEQNGTITGANPRGMCVVIRSDAGGTINETRVTLDQWNGDATARASVDWSRIQMLWIEYAWYGAGTVRFGVTINGKQILLHAFPFGNRSGQTIAWARTGNLPVRYEQRNTGTTASQNDMIHYGVSVLIEGGADDQRGFTYAYGNPQSAPRRSVAASANRLPVVSYRGRPMGTQEYTQATAACTAGSTTSLTAGTAAWTVDQWRGRFVNYTVSGQLNVARITSNTATVLTLADVVTGGALATAPVAGQPYIIGLINRGQMLPRRLQVTSDQPVYIEIFVSRPGSAVNLTGANFLTNAAAPNSFAQIDSSATAFTLSGECVYSIFVPANNPVDQQIDNLFPLVNTISGNNPDILTVAVSNPGASAANVSVQIIGQEAMS
jgi:hypothetical protein